MTAFSSRPALPLIISGVALVLAGALAGYALGRSGSGPLDRAAVETVVHNYILEHPEILPQAMENLRKKETGAQLSNVGEKVRKPFPGAIMGNPAFDLGGRSPVHLSMLDLRSGQPARSRESPHRGFACPNGILHRHTTRH